MSVGSRALATLLLASGCTEPAVETLDPKANESLLPGLTDIREGTVDLSEDDMPVLPVDQVVTGSVAPGARNYDLGDGTVVDPDTSTDTSAMIAIDDPLPLTEHRTSEYSYARALGRLTDSTAEGALDYRDVMQGEIANCYMAAALSAVLYADEDEVVRDGLIRAIANEDGQPLGYAVRVYHAWDEPQDVLVDADLLRNEGRVVYGRSADSAANAEEWGLSLVEKAFATWRKGYAKIGDGGFTGDVMHALTGATATTRWVSELSDRSIVSTIQRGAKDHRPMTAGTYAGSAAAFRGGADGEDPQGTQIFADHAYTVLDAATGTDGAYVKLRNPWGEVEPSKTFGTDPAFDTELATDDGIFWIALPHFKRLFEDLVVGGTWEADEEAPDAASDLEVTLVTDAGDGMIEVEIAFTATGDDGAQGLAFAYDLRVSKDPIADEADFEDAESVLIGSPEFPGEPEELVLTGLVADTDRYVAIRVIDEVGNASDVVSAVIAAP